MRIALLGTRGIPANYGGFETFAEELSTRLAARGHEVTVYCRQPYPQATYRGVRLQYLPTIRHKYFDTIAHTALSTLHLLAHRTDAALYCNGANAIFTVWPRLLGIPVALNVDGIERRRKKWNRLARGWYLFSEWLTGLFPTVVIADARTIQDYYRKHYRKQSVFIPYGAAAGKVAGTEALATLGLEPGRYFLYVSRLEPENHPLEVREAFEKLATSMKRSRVAMVTSLSATLLTRTITSAACAIPRIRASSCPEPSMAPVTTNWVRTASPTFMRPRWAARTRR